MSDSPTLTIRGQRSDDWVELFAWWATNEQLLQHSVNLPYMTEDAFRDALNSSPENTHVLIAELSALSGRKQVVGMARLTVKPRVRLRHLGELLVIVHPDHQQTDTGLLLLEKALDLADNWLVLRRLEALVWADDSWSLALYEQVDFVREATLRHYALGNGHYTDAALLARLNTGKKEVDHE